MIRELIKKMYHACETLVRNHKKALLVGVLFVAVGIAWQTFDPQVVHAETESAAVAATDSAVTNAPADGGATDDAAAGINSGSFWLDLFSKILLTISRLFLSLTLFILSFIIEVAGYNDFLNASAVNVGWVMVRDITNMGFVIILLVIAFGTILGVEHYEWKKMLVKMVIAAVLVNFSRTICGLIIDVAQVVMITFLNGIAATAGGNLISMFSLDKIRDLSTSASPKSFDSSNYFIASIGAVFFSAIVMCVLAVFMVMLVARMIVLWILIVLSPLAFVLSVLPQTESYASKWWHEFGANVITGPVLLFFVWLAFVTAGNGKIYDEISTNKTAGATDESALLKGESSGIGAALEWNNMANFIIAIGMLMVGARVAGELGGIGGDWAGEAVSFGKKIGMYASGAMVARYAGKEAAKIPMRWVNTAKNLGLVGIGKTDEWRNKKAKELEDVGKAAETVKKIDKARLKHGGPLTKKDDEAYNKAQKTIEKAGILGATGGIGRWMAASVIETGGRKDKRVEDVEKAAHAQQKIVEETYSTSKSWQGKLKLDLGVREHQIEQFSEAKRKEKYAAYEQELIEEGDEQFHERGQTILGSRAKTEAAEANIKRLEAGHELEAQREADVEGAKAKLEALETGIQSEKAVDKFKAQRNADVFTAKAEAERRSTERESREASIKQDAQVNRGVFIAKAAAQGDEANRETERARATLRAEQSVGVAGAKAASEQALLETTSERERDVSRARDTILRGLNRSSEATNEQKTLEKQAKAKVEAQTVGDYVSAQARSVYQLGLVQAAEENVRTARTGGDPAALSQAQGVLDTLQRGMLDMSIGNMDRHAAYAENIQNKVLSDMRANGADVPIERNMENNATNILSNQIQHLIAITGRSDITADNIETVFESIPEATKAQIRLDSEKAAGQGALSMAGLYNIETQRDGTLKTVLTTADGGGVDYVRSRRESAMSGSKITTLAGFGGSMDKDNDGHIRVDSSEAVDIAVKLIAPVGGNILSNIDEYVKADFGAILQNSSEPRFEELLTKLRESSKNAQGLAGMLEFAAGKMAAGARKDEVLRLAADQRTLLTPRS